MEEKRHLGIIVVDGTYLNIDPHNITIDQVSKKCFETLTTLKSVTTAHLVFVKITEDRWFMWKNRTTGGMKYVDYVQMSDEIFTLIKNM